MKTEIEMSDLLKMNIPGKPEYVVVARMTAATVASSLGFDIEAVEDIRLAVGEACNNVVRHNSDDGKTIDFEIHFEVSGEGLSITVKDEGKGCDTELYEEPDTENPSPEGGLGLFIIKAMMDEVEFHSEIGVGTHITMKKKLARSA
jgi:serine/threonine-protein kinase RsbW